MWIISVICFAVLVVLAVIGEATLGLFGGDRDLARRTTLAVFALLGGVGFACLQPIIWDGFTKTLQRVIAKGGSQAPLTEIVLRPSFNDLVQGVVTKIAYVIIAASITLAWYLWNGGS
ncbi:MAG: hypothetical protein ABJN34_03410 [Litoreibacter sp.]|uniref:hypothetical protein n=1 Tax=Litoreibacter sp. TaxID=1969459 RepID=UPI003299D31A